MCVYVVCRYYVCVGGGGGNTYVCVCVCSWMFMWSVRPNESNVYMLFVQPAQYVLECGIVVLSL